MRSDVQTLTSAQIDYLKNFREQHVYNSKTQVIYHGQVPMAAYVLLEGKIDLKNARDKLVKECTPPTLLGFKEICEGTQFKYTAEILPGSKVLILDRSTAKEILHDLHINSEESPLLDIVS